MGSPSAQTRWAFSESTPAKPATSLACDTFRTHQPDLSWRSAAYSQVATTALLREKHGERASEWGAVAHVSIPS